ncbi:YezD family protein [Bacillus sp. FJAT-27251]|uniref:YezD family protein n=1 Tax=Bacillus sp. FJAT-27251 TaxID=1684142 RepID=UPI0009E42CE2|nr:YezD family protein [Bacillus sp. FJAT-27251]
MSLKHQVDQKVLDKIKAMLESLDFGTLQITVHDSQITQIDKLEKHRFPLQAKSKNQLRSRQ